ncbi:hypothetical protein IJ103_00235 [Candidatus Saccharibacteria bacterium]|nr:hypothetical protein [Candidatus Saccharibacteria bacterium]
MNEKHGASIHHKLLIAGISLIAGLALLNPAASNAQAAEAEKYAVTYPYYGFVEDPENPWESVYDPLDETGTVEYSDEFFSEPSPGDHPELRVVSYALALAGYENLSDGYPMESDVANPKLRDFLNQLGFHDYESWDVSSEIDGHSMGTTIAQKTLASGEKLIVVAPRNYNYMTEWLSNLNVGDTGDHAGFSEAASLIVARLNQYLASRNFENYKLWMVGYSRGGAVIDLAARNINAHLSDYRMSADDFYVYTFGAPRASAVETTYSNIHDVKDGNDLILGYLFPEVWGFYNTGTYEEIHPADLEITTSVIDITDIIDPAKAPELITSDKELTKSVGTVKGKDFMDSWLDFVTDSGLTREYFNNEVKPLLSALLQDYQLRTLDQQSAYLDFIKGTENGIAGRVAGSAFMDLLTGGYGTSMEEALSNFPPYQILVKVLEGTATDADLDQFVSYLPGYIGEYDDYEDANGESPAVTMAEFANIKENLPKLIRALAPIVVADAKYTRETFGDNYSLYHTYSLIANMEKLLYGHIPESMMPILKSLIPDSPEDEPSDEPSDGSEKEPSDESVDDGGSNEDSEEVIIDNETPSVPNTGDETAAPEASIALLGLSAAAVAGSSIAVVVLLTIKKQTR